MASVDIRNNEVEEITTIRFADPAGRYDANELAKYSATCFKIESSGDYMYVNFSDIDNLIAALRKAKELWD